MSLVCCHHPSKYKFLCEQPFTFWLSFRNGCIRNSLKMLSAVHWYSYFICLVPLRFFFPNTVNIVCKQQILQLKWHVIGDTNYYLHHLLALPVRIHCVTTLTNIIGVCKEVFQPFSATATRQPGITWSKSEKLNCCTTAVNLDTSKCLLLKYNWNLKLQIILWPQSSPDLCSIYCSLSQTIFYC